jgi:type IV secretion system protein VirB5
MKKILLSTIVASNLMFGSGIPVVDIAGNMQSMIQNVKEIATWAEEASRWSEEVQHYKNQIQAYADQLASQTEVRDSVQFTKDIDDFYNFSNSSEDFLSLEGEWSSGEKELYEKYNLFDDCEVDYYNDDEKRICENKVKRRVQEIAVYQDYTKTLDTISDNIVELATKLTNSQDVKESADIQNAISIQLAQLDLTKTKVELMNAQNERLDQIEREQKEQLISKSMKADDTSIFDD